MGDRGSEAIARGGVVFGVCGFWCRVELFVRSSRGLRFASLLLAVSLLGCTYRPKPQTVEAEKLPAQFVHDRSAKPAMAMADANFWSHFGSPELVDLIGKAQTNSQDIIAAMDRVEQALAVAEQARTALLPSATLNGTLTHERASASDLGLTTPLPDQRLYDFGITASYELDLWGKNLDTIHSAEHLVLASAYNVDTVRLSTASSVALLFLNILSARDLLRIARQNVQFATQVQGNIRSLVDAGSATEIDLAQQETVVLQQRGSIPALVRTIEQDESALIILLGYSAEGIQIKTQGLGALKIPSIAAGIPTDLLRRRPDVRSAEEQILSSVDNVEAAKAAMLPSITISAQGGFESPLFKNLFTTPSIIYTLIGGFAQPLLNEASLFAQLKLSDWQREELVADYRKAILSSISDVEKALVALQTTAQEEALARAALVTARRAYDLGRQQLRAGQIDITSILNSQAAYFTAANNLAQIVLTRFQAAVSLYQAVGGAWTAPDPPIDVHRPADCSESLPCP